MRKQFRVTAGGCPRTVQGQALRKSPVDLFSEVASLQGKQNCPALVRVRPWVKDNFRLAFVVPFLLHFLGKQKVEKESARARGA